MVLASKLKKILVTGASSRFCKFLKKDLMTYNAIFVRKNKFNITDLKQMDRYLDKENFTHLIHIAGLSRPMIIHETNISKSIDLNIIGTANVVKLCKKYNIKLIYFSTNYVYPGTKGNYKETDPLNPINNYAWSKLGGESAVHLYKNSLILRLCITDYPFVHKKAIKGAKSSFIFNKSVSKLIPLLLNEKGVINVGGEARDIFEFAKKFSNKKIKSISIKNIQNFPKNSSINIIKLKKILKKKIKINKFKF